MHTVISFTLHLHSHPFTLHAHFHSASICTVIHLPSMYSHSPSIYTVIHLLIIQSPELHIHRCLNGIRRFFSFDNYFFIHKIYIHKKELVSRFHVLQSQLAGEESRLVRILGLLLPIWRLSPKLQ